MSKKIKALLLSALLAGTLGCTGNVSSTHNSNRETPEVSTQEKEKPKAEKTNETTKAKNTDETPPKNNVGFDYKSIKEGYQVIFNLNEKIKTGTLDSSDLEKLKNAIITAYANIYHCVVSGDEISKNFFENNYPNMKFVKEAEKNEDGIYVTPEGITIRNAGNVRDYPVVGNAPLYEFGTDALEIVKGSAPKKQIEVLLADSLLLFSPANPRVKPSEIYGGKYVANYDDINMSPITYYLEELAKNPSDNTIKKEIIELIQNRIKGEICKAVADSLNYSNLNMSNSVVDPENIRIQDTSYDPKNNEEIGITIHNNGIVVCNGSNSVFWEIRNNESRTME